MIQEQRLEVLRKKSGLSVSNIAHMLGISTRSWLKIENGECFPPIQMVRQIAILLNVSYDQILFVSSKS